MSPSRRPSPSEPVRQARELMNAARNEQQKAILLPEVARIRTDLGASKLIADSEKLLRQSRKTQERAKRLRSG